MGRKVTTVCCEICNKEVNYLGRHLKHHHPDYDIKKYHDEFICNDYSCKICGGDVEIMMQNGLPIAKQTCSKECGDKLGGQKRVGLKKSQEVKDTLSRKRKQYYKTEAGQKHRQMLSDTRKGDANPTHKQSAETKERMSINQSIRMKKLIAEGKWTPNITNSWCKSRTVIDNKPFRSSWEAAFYTVNKHLEYETVRVPYIFENKERTYIVDFVDREAKIIYEVKPDSEVNTPINKAKLKAAIKWCANNGYKLITISDQWFRDNYNKLDFVEYPFLESKMKQFV